MTSRYDMVLAIKENLLEKFNYINGYIDIGSDVVIGIPDFNNFPQRPCVGFWPYNDSINQENCDDNRERVLRVIFYGYTDTEEAIYELSEAVERFLYSEDFVYNHLTLFDPEGVTFTTGGISNQVGVSMFDLKFVVNYTQS
jgi:hypothetical protein